MLVNITEASKLAGIGRETLYKNYINKGKISTLRDERNRPMIDTVEILRVFGRLKGVGITPNGNLSTPHNPTPENTPPTHPDTTAELAYLKAENAQLRERLEEAKGREQWHQEQAGKLTDTIKLLEAPRPTPRPSFFARVLTAMK